MRPGGRTCLAGRILMSSRPLVECCGTWTHWHIGPSQSMLSPFFVPHCPMPILPPCCRPWQGPQDRPQCMGELRLQDARGAALPNSPAARHVSHVWSSLTVKCQESPCCLWPLFVDRKTDLSGGDVSIWGNFGTYVRSQLSAGSWGQERYAHIHIQNSSGAIKSGWHHSVVFNVVVTFRITIVSMVSACFASHGQGCPLLRTMVLHVLPALFALERALPAAQIRFS